MTTKKENPSTDVIVVGAGVIGLSCAWRAAHRGFRVRVLERDAPSSGASSVAAGMLAPVGELSFGEERLLRMTLASAALYPDFVGEVEAQSGISTGYQRCGALHLALDGDEAAELRRRNELQVSLGLPAEWLSAERCRQLEPGLAPALRGGIHARHEAAVDPRALSSALCAALEQAGAAIDAGVEVAALLVDGERVGGVKTGRGEEIHAGSVVLATGCWSGAADWLPGSPRAAVRPVKGQILELRGSADQPVCGRIVASERVYLVPRTDGRLLVGATVEERGWDLTVTAGGVHELLREAYRMLPDIAELELAGVAAGLRPGTPDNLPLVGAWQLDGLFLATGHFRNGVLLAPLTADAIAELLTGVEPEGPILAADPAREAKRPLPGAGVAR